MAINIKNTNYNGEVLEQILTLAATGNEIVERGLIHVIPNVHKKISIPRLKTGKMLRKRKEMPKDADGKGNFDYSEKELNPVDFMAFTTFNPRSFENVWREFQPKGNLVFSELPPEIQNKLLSELTKQVKFELGWHYINGKEGTTDDELFNGIITQIKKDEDTVYAGSSAVSMVGQLSVLKRHIPQTMRSNPGLRILMSVEDFDRYDDELTKRPYKGVDYTDTTPERFKGIDIEKLTQWPSGLITATITGMDYNTNLWAAVNLQDDEDVIQIDKLENAGERYFFKLLMKADTNIAFGEEVIMLKKVPAQLKADQKVLTFPVEGGEETIVIEATEEYTVTELPEGYTTFETENGLLISADDNSESDTPVDGKIVLSLKEHRSKKLTITVSQPAGVVTP